MLFAWISKIQFMTQDQYRVFDNLIEGVQVISPDFNYVYVNNAVISQSKKSSAELIGNKMAEVFPGIQETEMFRLLQKCLSSGEVCQMLNEFVFPDGSLGWFQLRMQPVDEGVLIMSFDITPLKKLEIELLELNASLEDKVKRRTAALEASLDREKELNELKSAFVSMASHEFRTPLSTIKSSASLVDKYEELRDTENVQKHTGRIKSSVVHLTSILNDFLSLSKLEAGKIDYLPKEVNLYDYTHGIIEELQPLCIDGQHINHHHDGNGITVNIDPYIVKNVLNNLISNAVKYSPSGKDVDLTTSLKENVVNIEVKDHGIGIPLEEQNKMFQKFFRANNTRDLKGTGLGLNIVKQYLDLAGGTIDFTSKENTGTTFTVRIPQ